MFIWIWFNMAVVFVLSTENDSESPLIAQFIGGDIEIYRRDFDNISVIYKVNADIQHNSFYERNLAMNVRERMIAWHDPTSGRMQRAFVDRSNITTLIEEVKTTASSIDIDWIGRNIYWTNTHLGIIKVSDIDGQFSKTLFQFPKNTPPILIALNPKIAYIYMVIPYVMMRAQMNGKQETVKQLIKVTGNLLSLSIDFENNRLYFSTNYKIYHCNELGMDIRTVPALSNIDLVTGKMALYKHFIYFTYMTFWNLILRRCDRKTGGNCEDIREGKDLGVHFLIFDISMQESDSFKLECSTNRVNCSHLCLLGPVYPYFTCSCPDYAVMTSDNKTCKVKETCEIKNGGCTQRCLPLSVWPYHSCACYEGYFIKSDNKTCISGNDEILIIATRVSMWEVWLNVEPLQASVLPIQGLLTAPAPLFDFDPVKRTLYWYHLSGMMWRMDFDTYEKVLITNSKIVTRYAWFQIDWLTTKIYILTGVSHFAKITVWNLDFIKEETGVRETLKRLYSTRLHFVALDIFEGDVWIYESAGNSKITRNLLRVNVHTAEVTSSPFATTNSFRLCMDVSRGKVIWQKFYNNSLHMSNVDGSNEIVILEEMDLMYRCNIQDNNLYWITGGMSHENGVRITHMDLKTFKDDLILNSASDIELSSSTNIKATMLFEKSGNVEECLSPIFRCFGITGAWICLTKDMICDGTTDCLENHDERYCFLCSPNCSFSDLSLICSKQQTEIKPTNVTQMADLIAWSTHPFSLFVTLNSVLSFECTLDVRLDKEQKVFASASDTHVRHLTITSFFSLHKLRQVVFSKLFSDLSRLKSLVIEGVGTFKLQLVAGHFRPLRSLESLTILDTSLLQLPDYVFQGLYHLKVLKVNKNTKLNILNIEIFNDCEQLVELTISDNGITSFQSALFSNLTQLTKLFLSEAKIQVLENGVFHSLINLEELTITGTRISVLESDIFRKQIKLKIINLSSNQLKILSPSTLAYLQQLQVIDLRGNAMNAVDLDFQYNQNLTTIYGDSYSLCCIRPKSVKLDNCHAPLYDISSCENLIPNTVLRVILWTLGIMAIIGNIAVVLFSVEETKRKLSQIDPYLIFSNNLAISDMLMGVYMLTIAVSDVIYSGRYVWNEYLWKRSMQCSISGFIAIVSNEMSVFLISIITLECYLNMKYQSDGPNISRKGSYFILVLMWAMSVIIALIPSQIYPNVFSRSDVCFVLPLKKNDDDNLIYFVAIYAGFNMVLCTFITFGQIMIYLKLREAAKQCNQDKKQETIAKRFFLVVLTDAVCWIAIGSMVIASIFGLEIPREVYIWIMLFALPVNSALNPFIYIVFSVMMPVTKNKVKLYELLTSNNRPTSKKFNDELIVEDEWGLELKGYLAENRNMSCTEVYIITTRVAGGLAFIHEHDLIHGQVELSNVRVSLQNQTIHEAGLVIGGEPKNDITDPAQDMEKLGFMVGKLMLKVGLHKSEIQ